MTSAFQTQFAAQPSGGLPSWLLDLRQKSMSRFLAQGFPSVNLEDWKYTSLDSLTKMPFQAPLPHLKSQELGGQLQVDFLERSSFMSSDDLRIVFVNGFFSPAFSHLGGLPEGVFFGNLSDVLKERPDLAKRHIIPQLSRADFPEERSLMSLNTAFLNDGAILIVPKGIKIDRPIFFVHFSWTESQPTVSHPRNLVVLEENAHAQLIEIYAGSGPGAYCTNSVTEITTGPNSSLEHYRIQQESGNAFHLGVVDVSQSKDSRYESIAVSLGAHLNRSEIRTALKAEGASCTLDGLYMATGTQHVDHQTTIDHVAPHGTSLELYKGVLSGRAKGIFNGKIIVRPGAQKTSARQYNRNLLLSNDAVINTKPLLEIFANDVKCNHGATTGRLDPNQLFYLRARGIEETQAKSLLTYAFAAELIEKIRREPLKIALEKTIFRRLMADELGAAL
jgi:Fe-S cluster assembly protein SufD